MKQTDTSVVFTIHTPKINISLFLTPLETVTPDGAIEDSNRYTGNITSIFS